jgi:hypothetical protein
MGGIAVTVIELIQHLKQYPDDMRVMPTLDYGSGLLEREVDNVVSTDEWDEQRKPPDVLLIEKDTHASEY